MFERRGGGERLGRPFAKKMILTPIHMLSGDRKDRNIETIFGEWQRYFSR